MSEPIYFAAGYYFPTEKRSYGKRSGESLPVAMTNEPKRFMLVGPVANEGGVPYITKNVNGLRLTSHHANLYVLQDDGKTAELVNYRCPQVARFEKESITPVCYEVLTDKQVAALKTAIEAGHFFD